MADSILVPQVGQDLTEAKVVALHVKLGDIVKKGDVVAEVESEKASFEVEAFAAGTVIQLPYGVGDTATVLQPLVILGNPGETVGKAEAVGTSSAAPQAFRAESQQTPDAPPLSQTGDGFRSSPLARRVAAVNGIDIKRLNGSGPKGAIVLRDVKSVLQGGMRAVASPGQRADATGINTRSLRDGTGDPIVFIHGFGAELAAWRPLVGSIPVGNPMVGLDLPAHGASPAPGQASFEQIVSSVAAALIAEGRTRLHLVGHSLGAAVAAALAAQQEVDVRSLTLMSPAGLGPKINGDFLNGFLGANSEPALKAWMLSLVHEPANLPGAMVRATLNAREGTELAAGQSRLAKSLFSGSTQLFSIRDALRQVAAPCRIIVGREDAIIPSDQTDNLPGHVAIHKLAGVGHLPFLEAAALAGRLVAETVRAG